jgi:hypothetical protein
MTPLSMRRSISSAESCDSARPVASWAQPDDAADEPELRHALRDEQPAVDARQPDGVDPEIAQR